MHIRRILTKTLQFVTSKKRLDTICHLVEGIFSCKHLTLTNLGRSLNLNIQERSMVKRVDRFLANNKIEPERLSIYSQMANKIICNKINVQLLVDWSNLPNTKEQLLKASLAYDGRSLSIYEEVWEEKYYGTQTAHNHFLDNLKKVLPEKCIPIIITDAGYHNPWFKKVDSLGWFYIGRIRGKKVIRRTSESSFVPVKTYFNKELSIEKDLGEIELCKNSNMITNLYGFKAKPKNRKAHRKCGKKRNANLGRASAKSAKEPWLLVSNLPTGYNIAKKVVGLYKKRMQIEEEFRDLKSTKFGFGFENMRSKGKLRLSNFILLTTIAQILACLIGTFAEYKGWHRQYQISSTKKKRVLSLFFLGCRVIKRKINNILIQEFNEFFKSTEIGSLT